MKVSVEISIYPLNPEYGTPILQFIGRLKNYPGLHLQTNTMSTQLFGEYDVIMGALTKEMKVSFEADQTIVIVIKAINLNLKP